MELLQRSLQGGILILVILAIRVLWLDKMPKRMFPVLWGVALVRLLAPFSVSSAVSVYSFLQRAQRTADTGLPGAPGNVTVKGDPGVWKTLQELTLGQETTLVDLSEQGEQVQLFPVIWCIGAVLCGTFFLMSYLRSLRSFRRSVPVENGEVLQWLRGHRAGRIISVRQSEGISAPLTYGILRPVILLPGRIVWGSGQELEYILQHEYVHIAHWDGAVKLAMVAALCVHWFNPLVWIMTGLLGRDIELACDEGVLRRFGEQARVGYAMALIGMEEKKRSLMPLFNGFSKNAIEERIHLIMKYKKIKYMTVIAASLLVSATILMFATSAKTSEAKGQGGEDTAQGAGSAQETEWDAADLENELMDPPKEGLGAFYSDAGREPGTDTAAGGVQVNLPDSGGIGTGMARSGDGSGADGAQSGGAATEMPQTGDGSGAGTSQSGGAGTDLSQAGDGSGAGASQSGGAGIDAPQSRGGAGNTQAQGEPAYKLQYMQEGMLQEEPANLYVGSGYCLLIPVEGWQPYGPDAWMWESNEQVQFWVADYTGNTPEQAINSMKKDGYSETGEGLLSREQDGRIFFAQMRQSGSAVMCINYVYPADAEHVEGFGRILPAIADSFGILAKEGQSGLSEDARQAQQTALDFWAAYLAGNREAMERYLTKDCRDREIFPDGEDGHVAEEAMVNAVKGLDIGTKAVGESCEISVEFRPAAGADHLEYLTLEMVKEADGWKISFYGLEF